MSSLPDICLGCGNTFLGAYCLECEAKAVAVVQFGHWPLETSLSLAALAVVEDSVLLTLEDASWDESSKAQAVRIELHNLTANIRSHLQHAGWDRARKAAEPTQEKDPLLR